MKAGTPSKIALLLILVLIFSIFTVSNLSKKNPAQKPISPVSISQTSSSTPVKQASSSANASFAPTPSPTPTPTPVPLGYCLRIPVIYYHHIQPQSEAITKSQTSVSIDNGYFDQQMAYLNSHGYTTIFANDLINALNNHTSTPQKSILVTIDDGYSDLYTYAFPIIRKYNVKANLMIASGLINNSGFATWDQLREMNGSSLVYFVDHTWSHSAVNSGSLEKIKYEIETAKTQIEQNLGQTITSFAYPYGSYSNTSINVLKQDGFLGAFTTIPGFFQCDSFIFTLHRNPIGNAPLPSYGL